MTYVEKLQDQPELFLLFSESQAITAIPGADGIKSNADEYGRTLLAIIEDVAWPPGFCAATWSRGW